MMTPPATAEQLNRFAIWVFPPGIDHDLALDPAAEPDARAVLVSSGDAVITVEIVEGKLPGWRSRIYAEHRGWYEIESWQASAPTHPGGAWRQLFTLSARGAPRTSTPRTPLQSRGVPDCSAVLEASSEHGSE